MKYRTRVKLISYQDKIILLLAARKLSVIGYKSFRVAVCFCRAIGINMSRSNGRCVFATISIVREGEREIVWLKVIINMLFKIKITTTENLYVK